MAPRYSFVVCKASGEPVGEALAAKGRQLTRTLNQPATATLSLQLGDSLAPYVLPGTGRLKVYRAATPSEVQAGIGKTLVFYGSLPTTGLTMDAASDTLTVVYKDPRWVLERRFTHGSTGLSAGTTPQEQYAAVAQGQIIMNGSTGLIDVQNLRAGGDTWIIPGAISTMTLRDRNYSTQSVSQLIDDLTRVSGGPDLDAVPFDGYSATIVAPITSRTMANLNVYDRQGSDRPNAAFAYGPGTLANVQNAQLAYLEATTVAQFTGNDANGQPLTSTYGTADSAGLGLLDNVFSDPDVSIQATLDQKARGLIAEQSSLRPIISISEPLPGAPRFLVDYFIGDTIRVQVVRGAFTYTGSPRVYDVSMDIDQEGYEKVSMVLST